MALCDKVFQIRGMIVVSEGIVLDDNFVAIAEFVNMMLDERLQKVGKYQ